MQCINYLGILLNWNAFRLKAEGVDCEEISTGATPTASVPGSKVKAITEIHTGNYVFYGKSCLKIFFQWSITMFRQISLKIQCITICASLN